MPDRTERPGRRDLPEIRNSSLPHSCGRDESFFGGSVVPGGGSCAAVRSAEQGCVRGPDDDGGVVGEVMETCRPGLSGIRERAAGFRAAGFRKQDFPVPERWRMTGGGSGPFGRRLPVRNDLRRVFSTEYGAGRRRHLLFPGRPILSRTGGNRTRYFSVRQNGRSSASAGAEA